MFRVPAQAAVPAGTPRPLPSTGVRPVTETRATNDAVDRTRSDFVTPDVHRYAVSRRCGLPLVAASWPGNRRGRGRPQGAGLPAGAPGTISLHKRFWSGSPPIAGPPEDAAAFGRLLFEVARDRLDPEGRRLEWSEGFTGAGWAPNAPSTDVTGSAASSANTSLRLTWWDRGRAGTGSRPIRSCVHFDDRRPRSCLWWIPLGPDRH